FMRKLDVREIHGLAAEGLKMPCGCSRQTCRSDGEARGVSRTRRRLIAVIGQTSMTVGLRCGRPAQHVKAYVVLNGGGFEAGMAASHLVGEPARRRVTTTSGAAFGRSRAASGTPTKHRSRRPRNDDRQRVPGAAQRNADEPLLRGP